MQDEMEKERKDKINIRLDSLKKRLDKFMDTTYQAWTQREIDRLGGLAEQGRFHEYEAEISKLEGAVALQEQYINKNAPPPNVTEDMIRNSKIDIVGQRITNMASELPSSGLPMKPARSVREIPCIAIAAADWLAQPDVQAWAKKRANGVPRLWCEDVFTVYDHDEGPHSPISDPEYAMPQWLWNEIAEILKERGIGYAIVRLLNTEAP
jgi:hypothetical protein